MSLSVKLSESGGVAPEAVPYMPAGECVIDASVNGVPGRRRVLVTREGCERLQRDLEEHLAAAAQRKKARPLLMFDHNVQGGGAAVPKRFVWEEGRGILLEVEWTAAGREAVEGGVYGYVSPAFRLQRSTGEILGLAGGVEVGSLVNDPAFEGNECIAAGREVADEVVVVAAHVLPPHDKGVDVVSLVDNKGSSGEGAGVVTEKKNRTMEEIAKLLGLPADADSATICAKISALKNEGAANKKRIEEVEAEKEEHKKALHNHKEAAADAFVERVKKEGKVAPHDKERLAAARAMYLNDAAGAECIFAGMKRVDNVREEAAEGADKVQAGAAKRDYSEFSLVELLAAERE